jgi:hypothetical protein
MMQHKQLEQEQLEQEQLEQLEQLEQEQLEQLHKQLEHLELQKVQELQELRELRELQEQQYNTKFVENLLVKYSKEDLATHTFKSYIFKRETIEEYPIEILKYLFCNNKDIVKSLLDLFPDPNNCDILINILFVFSCSDVSSKDIIELLKNHHYLFNNDNMTRAGDIYAHIGASSSGLDYTSSVDIIARMTDEEIIEEIKKNIFVLLLIPDHKLSDKIIFEAMEKSMDTLLLLPRHMLRYHHYEQAINMDFKLTGNHENSLPKIISDMSDKLFDHLSDKLIIHALTQNGESLDLLYVNTIKFEYCLQAVKQNGYALTYVPNNLKTKELLDIAIATNPKLKREDLIKYYESDPERTFD